MGYVHKSFGEAGTTLTIFYDFVCTNRLFLASCVTEEMVQSKRVDYKEEVEALKSGLKEARARANI